MSTGWKCFLWFAGGAFLGAAGAAVVCRGNTDFKPIARQWLSRGMVMKDAVMAKVATAKEDMEDLMAEARHACETRNECADAKAEAPQAAEKKA